MQPGNAAPNASHDGKLRRSGERVVIHHLADFYYNKSLYNTNVFKDYTNYLQNLQPDQIPHLILFSGNISLIGNAEEIHEAKVIISGGIKTQPGGRTPKVCIVPGPHDQNWLADSGDSYAKFREEMGTFTIPSFFNQQMAYVPGAEPYLRSEEDNYVIYLLNTNFTSELLGKIFSGKQFEAQYKATETLIRSYRALWRDELKRNSPIDDALRLNFIRRVSVLHDSGIVYKEDIERFIAIMQRIEVTQPGVVQSDNTIIPPLKILTTHHPLISYAGNNGTRIEGAHHGGEMLQALRKHSFQIIAHGHTHDAHITSDLSLDRLYDSDELPLLQIGAGSLADALTKSTFNEMIATYDRQNNGWSLDIRAIPLKEVTERRMLHYPMYQPLTETKQTKTGASSASSPYSSQTIPAFSLIGEPMQQSFHRALGLAVEDFTNDVTLNVPDMLTRSMQQIERLISQDIFAGELVRMGLFIKQRYGILPHPGSGLITMDIKYIDPGQRFDPQYIMTHTYPLTMASWSLILGEALIFPLQDPNRPIDNNWLREADKLNYLLDTLQKMSEYPNADVALRSSTLLSKLSTGTMVLGDSYSPPPAASIQSQFTSFIAIPLPLRPVAYGRPVMKEMGVLNIDVVDKDPLHIGSAFTPERVEMLKTLSYVMSNMMFVAHRLEHPSGAWVR